MISQSKLAAHLCFSVLSILAVSTTAFATPVFINEIHYDNAGADVGEAIEIAGPAGVDIAQRQQWCGVQHVNIVRCQMVTAHWFLITLTAYKTGRLMRWRWWMMLAWCNSF